MGAKDDEERTPDLITPGTRRTRSETVDHAAIARALKEAFEAGGSAARAALDVVTAALKEAYAENARLHGRCDTAIERSQELVGKLATVASQNVALTLAEGHGRTSQTEAHEKGESLRHGLTLLATNPFLGVVLEKLLPGVKVTPPRPAGPGDTPREAAERLAASLRSGSENSKNLLENLELYCAEELGRPGDFALLVEFLGASLGGSVETSAPDAAPAPEAAA